MDDWGVNYGADREERAERLRNGIIPATVGSALQINGLPLIQALYEDPEQNCIKVNLLPLICS